MALSVCATCGQEFQPQRRGQQRERRCAQCRREWRWSGRKLHRLPRQVSTAAVVNVAPGALWPELVADELERKDHQ
jgi:DNA-directed RNA polymerase subunit RPC12/RpoP